ncbi:hypothetical protein quinque_015628 [Culex quinquefasciatus]
MRRLRRRTIPMLVPFALQTWLRKPQMIRKSWSLRNFPGTVYGSAKSCIDGGLAQKVALSLESALNQYRPVASLLFMNGAEVLSQSLAHPQPSHSPPSPGRLLDGLLNSSSGE